MLTGGSAPAMNATKRFRTMVMTAGRCLYEEAVEIAWIAAVAFYPND
jgi:hypothetical protein